MKKDSFVLYISQYIAIKDLTDEQLGKLFRAIFEKQLGNEVVLDNDIKIAFNFINNQMVVDNEKYLKKCEILKNNAKKGGAPKGNRNAKKSKQPNREKNNLNDNDNEHDNDNDNVNVNDLLLTTTTTIYSYVEENFGRTLGSVEVVAIDEWLSWFKEDVIKHAIKIAVFNGKKTFNYVEGILKNWKSCNLKTLQEIKDAEIKRKEKKEEKVQLFDYDWLNEGE